MNTHPERMPNKEPLRIVLDFLTAAVLGVLVLLWVGCGGGSTSVGNSDAAEPADLAQTDDVPFDQVDALDEPPPDEPAGDPLPDTRDTEVGDALPDTRDADSPEDAVDDDGEESDIFTFAVFGDNQFATNSCTSGTAERRAVPALVVDLAPTLLLHTGDLMDHGYEDGAYDSLVGCYADMLAVTPFFPTGGNHDFGSGGITAYKAYLERQLFDANPIAYHSDYAADFAIFYEDDPNEYSTDRDNPVDRSIIPGGVTWKTYYAFRYRNAYFISFEQGTRWWSQTPFPWLESQLGAARSDPEIDHIFVTMHHPMYSATMAESADGECIEPVRRYYEPLFQEYDVTMVFSGHAHCYDRFYVPDDGHSTREQSSEQYLQDGSGVHYVVTGGGGGGLTNGCSPLPERHEYSYQYSQARGCYHHITHVEVDGPLLNVTIVSVNGGADGYESQVVDRFVIR